MENICKIDGCENSVYSKFCAKLYKAKINKLRDLE